MNTNVQTPLEALSLAEFGRGFLDDLTQAAASAETRVDEEERSWLEAAVRRVGVSLDNLDSLLSSAWQLPELEAIRKREIRARQEAWAESVSVLHASIVDHTSANGPLVEVLFPHTRFEKLRRLGAAAESFHVDYQRRRRSQYVQRLASEPEYPFLAPLLDVVDCRRNDLEQSQLSSALPEKECDGLRQSIGEKADLLTRVLGQARSLANAALMTSPEQLDSFGLNAKPRRRTSRKTSPPRA